MQKVTQRNVLRRIAGAVAHQPQSGDNNNHPISSSFPSNHSNAQQRRTYYNRSTETDLTATEQNLIKQLAFNYGKHHRVRPHHAYGTNRSLWSDRARQMLTREDLPILRRLKTEQSRLEDEQAAAKLAPLRTDRGKQQGGELAAAADQRKTRRAAERFRVAAPVVPEIILEVLVGSSSSGSSSETDQSKKAVDFAKLFQKSVKDITASTVEVNRARAELRGAVASVTKTEKWMGTVKDSREGEAKLLVVRKQLVRALAREMAADLSLVHTVDRANAELTETALEMKSENSHEEQQDREGGTNSPSQPSSTTTLSHFASNFHLNPFLVPAGSEEAELHAATTRLFGCVLVAQNLVYLAAAEQQCSGEATAPLAAFHSFSSTATDAVADQVKSNVEQTILNLAEISAGAIETFMALQSEIDLENYACADRVLEREGKSGHPKIKSTAEYAEAIEKAEREAQALEKLLLKSYVFSSYLLTDPILAKASTIENSTYLQRSALHQLADNNNAAAASSTSTSQLLLSPAARRVIDGSDAMLASLLPTLCSVVYEGVLGESLIRGVHHNATAAAENKRNTNNEQHENDTDGGNGESSSTMPAPPKLSPSELVLAAKSAVSFADTTSSMDGNEFYAQVLSPLQQAIHKITLSAKEVIEKQGLKATTDVFGKQKRAVTPRDFPVKFSKIRDILDSARVLATVTERHYVSHARENPYLLDSSRSAQTSRRRNEAILELLALVPNQFFNSEHAVVTKWLASVSVRGFLGLSSSSFSSASSSAKNLQDKNQKMKSKNGKSSSPQEESAQKLKAERERFAELKKKTLATATAKHRANYIFACARATQFSPQGGTATSGLTFIGATQTEKNVDYEAVLTAANAETSANTKIRLLESLSKLEADVRLPNFPNDERNEWSQSVRAILKSMGAAEEILRPARTAVSELMAMSENNKRQHDHLQEDGGVVDAVDYETRVESIVSAVSKINTLLTSAEAIRFMGTEMWRSLAKFIVEDLDDSKLSTFIRTSSGHTSMSPPSPALMFVGVAERLYNLVLANGGRETPSLTRADGTPYPPFVSGIDPSGSLCKSIQKLASCSSSSSYSASSTTVENDEDEDDDDE